MSYPTDLKYTRDHEWVRQQGDIAVIGITEFAQRELGDIVFVELPQVGASTTKDEAFGTIESVKAVSELYGPVSGEIVAINSEVIDEPEVVNEDPYGEGWLIQVRMSNQGELASLMSASDYDKFVQEG